MSIHAVVSDTDWDFFLEVHWRALGSRLDFEPEMGPLVRTLGNESVSNELRKHHRVSTWVLKRDCIPVLRWVLWSETDHPETANIDLLAGVDEELTTSIWSEFNKWLVQWSKAHGVSKISSQTLLPWFESIQALAPPQKIFEKSGFSEIHEIKSDSPALLPFRAKIEKSRLLSHITFSPMDWNIIPKKYQSWMPWLNAVVDHSLCFMAVREGKTVGFIIGMPHYAKYGETTSQELYRGHAHLFWKLKSKFITSILSKKTKSAKILWIAEDSESKELGASVILVNEFLKRCFERGMKSVETPLISEDQYVLGLALKELGATSRFQTPHFSREFS